MPHQSGAYIACCGPIGVGKSTLAEHLATDLGAVFMPERFDAGGNPFLDRFYAERRDDSERAAPDRSALPSSAQPGWGLPTELSFLCQRVDMVRDITVLLAAGRNVVSDWAAPQNLVFSRRTLPDDEFALYESLYARLMEGVRMPDLIVCLDADVTVLQDRIRRRNRGMERGITADYLASVRAGYAEWRAHPPTPILWLDTNQLPFTSCRTTRRSTLTQIRDALSQHQAAAMAA